MHPMVLLLIAICAPFVLSALLFGPIYAGLAGASYLIYIGSAADALAARMGDVFYIIDVYSKLFTYWQAHMDAVSLTGYTLPLLLPPVAGLLIGLWLTRKCVRRLSDVFHMSVSA